MGEGTPGSAAHELRERLAPVAAQMGAHVPLPGGESSEARIAPQVNLSWPVGSRLARQIAQLVTNCGIFLMGDRVVTVDEMSGKREEMKPVRFGSWLEHWIETSKMDRMGDMRPQTMGKALAEQVLEADQFRYALRELRASHPVRMPVMREGGRSVDLLPAGYDEGSGIYTSDSVKYRRDMTIAEARKVFYDILHSYPFADLKADGSNFFQNRSVAVMMALMVGNYCRGMFPVGALRPMGLFIGNQPGTGKGTLAQMSLTPVFGMPKLQRKPKDDAEFEKQLDTVALNFSEYMVLDDIGGGLFSNALNAFLTTPVNSGRRMGGQTSWEAANVTQVLATGNQIKTTRDLERRSLIVELHLAGEVEGRPFDQVITPEYLARPEVRSRMLSALWAMVRTWSEAGCPRVENAKPTFEQWTEIVAGIVRCAGFSDPLEKAELGAGGDEDTSIWKNFLSRIAGEGIMQGETERDFTVKGMLETAKEWEDAESGDFSVDDLVGNAKDPSKAFGRRISAWKGREIIDTQGRLVQFGNYRQGTRRVYPCKVLSDPRVSASQ